MDEAAASKILENYLTGQTSEADFEHALEFLKNAGKFDPGLTSLYRDMDLPGGISHDTAQEIMPYYLEPLARAQLPANDRARFVAHLAQCRSCAADFLELRGFQAEVKRAGQAATVTGKAKEWPELEAVIHTLSNLAQTLRYSITFSPAFTSGVRETGAIYQAAENHADDLSEFKVLFEDTLGEEAGVYLEAVVTAWRISPTSCDLQVELNDPVSDGRQAGQTVILTYDSKKFTQKTDQSGETVFHGLEIAKLATLEVEIQINS